MRNIRNPYLYLVIILAFFIFALFLTLVLSGGKQLPSESPKPTIPPSVINNLPSKISPILTTELPFNPPEQGGGIDLKANIVQESQNQIAKLLPFLPYESDFKADDGQKFTILIPGAEYQKTSWVLDVQIFGVDYQVDENDPDYTAQKEYFLSAASSIFDWIKTKGGNPEKIIINWGDKHFIRERAEKWLNQ